MTPPRPNLSDLPSDVIAYIEALESQIAFPDERADAGERSTAELSEPPTTIQIISVSGSGMGKRTPRHLYPRQRRGGMGIFDLETSPDDPPSFLIAADESAHLLLITDHGRAFRLAVRDIAETAVRARGQQIAERLPLRTGERISLLCNDQAGAFLCLVSERGQMRRIAANYLGKNLNSGSVLQDPREGGRPATACWSQGSDELLIATRQGKAIRFSERLVPVRGCLGIRVEADDAVRAIAAAPSGGRFFLLSSEGKGAIREVETFAANKAPGSGGKALMKTDELIAAMGVTDTHDLFVISALGKMIRFPASDVPAKEGAVQGVNCMTLRADACVAGTASFVDGAAAIPDGDTPQ
jgi:DNA gyrase subunit A